MSVSSFTQIVCAVSAVGCIVAATVYRTAHIEPAHSDEVYNPIINMPPNSVPYTAMQQVPANVIGGNPTNATANISLIPVPSCDTTASALSWTTGGGLGCNSAIAAATAVTAGSATTATNALTLNGATFADAGAVGTTSLAIGGVAIKPVLTGTTNSFGGGLLTVGSCASGTATVTGATVGMVAMANPAAYQGDGVQFQSYVSAANTVTVKACALLLITPSATTYSVRVIQ